MLLLQSPLPVLHVPEQPLEYLYVTMYRYVDVIDSSGIAYVRLEVMHVLPEVVLQAIELLACCSVFVEDLD